VKKAGGSSYISSVGAGLVFVGKIPSVGEGMTTGSDISSVAGSSGSSIHSEVAVGSPPPDEPQASPTRMIKLITTKIVLTAGLRMVFPFLIKTTINADLHKPISMRQRSSSGQKICTCTCIKIQGNIDTLLYQ
jgi:hypothetical protein